VLSRFRITLLAIAGVLLVAGLLWLASPAVDYDPKTLFGIVVRVPDGDTIVLQGQAQQEYTVRLEGISAPEPRQPYGEKATDALNTLVAGKQVRVEWNKKDPYGRIVGDVYLPNPDAESGESADIWLNLRLIETGGAWHFKSYDKRDALAEAEQQARTEKVGLWAEANPEPPWEFRKRARKPRKSQ